VQAVYEALPETRLSETIKYMHTGAIDLTAASHSFPLLHAPKNKTTAGCFFLKKNEKKEPDL